MDQDDDASSTSEDNRYSEVMDQDEYDDKTDDGDADDSDADDSDTDIR
jgi:hypothetical protein